MICDYCQQPIEGDYNHSPDGEPVHKGECYRAVHTYPDDPDRDDADQPAAADGGQVERADGEPQELPDRSDHFLAPEEIAANFRDYLVALDAEMLMAEQAICHLENGDLDAESLMDVLPDPSPMKAWENDQFSEYDAGHFHLDMDGRTINIPDDGEDTDE